MQHVRETMPLLKQGYIDTGKVRYIYRPSFAVENDALRLAAESLYCAGEEGKFWAMHDWQYGNNDALIEVSDDMTATLDLLIREAAPAIGLNTVNLAACLQSERYRPVVEGFVEDARARNLTSTPTFLVNTELKVGATYEDLRALIEKELAK